MTSKKCSFDFTILIYITVGDIDCPSNWQLQIGCGTKEEDLKMAVRYMVKHCEENFITSVYVYCTKGKSLLNLYLEEL